MKLKYIQETLAFIAKNGYESDQIKFLKSTAVFLAELLDVNFVLIDKYSPKKPTTIETVAFYANGEFKPNIVYKLSNTPCDTIIGKKLCSYPANVINIFPKDDFLRQNNMESYIGKPLWNSKKEPIGLIALLDTKPKSLTEEDIIKIVLDIISIKIEEVLEKMLFESHLNSKIEELNTAKEKAEKNEHQLKEAQQMANLGHWELDIVNDKLIWSDEVFRIFDLQPKQTEASEDLFMKMVHPDDVEKLEKAYFDAFENKSSYEVNYRLLFDSGKIKHIQGKGFSEYNEDGMPIFSLGTILDITSQIKIQNELIKTKESAEKNEKKYRKLSNLIFEGIVIIEEDEVVLECNDVFLKMFGYSHKEIIGKSIIHQLFPEKYHEQIRANRNKRHTLPFEIEGIKKDSSFFPVEIEARNIDLGNNKINRLVTIRDLTLRKKDQFENKKLSIAIEQSANTVIITDINANIEYTNPKFTEISGYTAAEVLGKNPRILNSGAQPKEFYANLWQTIVAGNIWKGQMKNKTKSGKFYWEQVTITPIKDENGNNLSYLAIKEDITHRKIAEDNLIESEEKYRFLFENNPQPMWIYDFETLSFLEVNNAAIQHYGYTREEFLSMTLKDIRPKEDIEALSKDIEIAKRISYNPASEWLHIKKSGEIISVNIVAHKVTFNQREARHILINDITSTKKAEKELLTATEEIAKSEKKFRELFEKSGDAVLIIKNGVFVDCNQATLDLLGYKNFEAVLNHQPSELSPILQPDGKDSSKKAEALIKITLEKGTHRFDWWHNKSNGEIFPVEVLLTTIENEPNNQTIHCVWRDITNRKQAAEKLQEQKEEYKVLSEDYFTQNTALMQLSDELSEKNSLLIESKDRFINLFEQNPVALWEQDFSAVIKLLKDKKFETTNLKIYLDENPDFVSACISKIKILNVNRAALELFGVKNVEELKNHLRKTNNKKALEVLKNELVSIGSNKKTFSGETELIGKGGSPILAFVKSVIIDDYGTSIASVIDITTERNATIELLEQKLLFEKMFNAIHDCIIITNTNREIVMANQSVKNILGFSPKELIGKSTEIFYADNSKFEKAGDKVFSEHSINKEEDFITYYKTKENVIFPGETFGSKLFNNQGEWIGNIGVIKNVADRLNFINELQKAKEIAEKSENNLNEAQKIAQIGSYELDFSTGIWNSTPALNKIFGIGEKYNRNISGWFAIIHPDDLQMMERYYKKNILENKEEFSKEYRIIRNSDKQICWVHGLGKLELDNTGNLKKMIGTIQDISDKRQILQDLIIAKEKAEESETNLKKRAKELLGLYTLYQLTEKNINPEIIYKTLINDIIPKSMQYSDKVYCKLEINNQIFCNSDDCKICKSKICKIPEEKKYLLEKIWVNEKEIGELKVFYTENLPFIEPYETNLIEAYAQNISVFLDRKDLFEKLLNSKEKAEESDRLKTEFIQNMSHEIRTPMNGILGFSELLDNPNLAAEKRKRFVEIIKSNTHQLLHIIDDIMEISVLETKQIKAEENPVCLNDLLHELFAVFNLKATHKNIELVLKNGLTNLESTILTDKNKLNKVLSNLLENALKFTDEGFVELGYKLNKDSEPVEMEIYVKDSGIGIRREKQQLIFDRFSQAEKELSKKTGGLGLGLSIAKENVALLGGKITVVSEFGKGAAFFVSIPYKPVIIAAEISIEKEHTSEKKDKYTILIAEDEEINFMVLETLLVDRMKLSCTILHAKDGLEAIALSKTNPDIGLVLMDIKMPKMDGHEATKRIKELRPNIPIIAQTAYSTPEEKEKAFLAGCDDFMSKPISKDVLKSMLGKYLLMDKNNGTGINN